MKTIKNIKNIIATIFTIALMAVCNQANAQEADTVQVKTTVNAASIIGTANSNGCFHGDVIDGFIHVNNCNGTYGGIVAGYSNLNYKNNSGKASVGAGKFGIMVGHRYGILRVEGTIFYTTPFEVEGRKYSAPEAQLAINIDFNRHSVVDFYIAPTLGYKFTQSQTNDEDAPFTYEGNVFMVGGKAGAMIRVGNPSHDKEVEIGNRKVTYYKHSQLFIKIEANYQFGQVSKPAGDKLTMNEAYANIGLVWKW